jgi:hypothetical protein
MVPTQATSKGKHHAPEPEEHASLESEHEDADVWVTDRDDGDDSDDGRLGLGVKVCGWPPLLLLQLHFLALRSAFDLSASLVLAWLHKLLVFIIFIF